jgi:4-hydroxy-4-methyl-2-oxoglutarate aldolase
MAAGDNLAVHYALERAEEGEVICVSAPGGGDFGIWGEITTECAIQRGVSALVTSCGVRDVEAIEALGFPVFARSHTIQGTIKRYAGKHEVPVRIGSAIIHHGDWIACDADGCVVIRAAYVEEVVSAAAEKAEVERQASAAIRTGTASREALGLP